MLFGEQARFFEHEIKPHLRHKKRGMLGMVGTWYNRATALLQARVLTVAHTAAGGKLNASQFYITLGEDLDSLDEKYTIFGEVAEGMEVVDAINDAYCDEEGRPYQNIRCADGRCVACCGWLCFLCTSPYPRTTRNLCVTRIPLLLIHHAPPRSIRHTAVLEDPFDDPAGLAEHIPERSPEPVFAAEPGRLEEDWVPQDDTRDADEVEASNRANEAANRAVVLEMIGDLPDADVKPPSNMLFVCKLNPVTTDEDLEIVFSRFGHITSCDVIKDWKTGASR